MKPPRPKDPLSKAMQKDPPKAVPRSEQLFKCLCGEFDRLTNQCKLCDACPHCCKCKLKPVTEPELDRVGEQDGD